MTIPDATKAKIPNALTIARVATGWMPGVLVAWRPKSAKVRWVATGLFAAIALTDLLDGKLARKWGVVSDFGKLWDPVGDKELIGASGAGLVAGKGINPLAGIAFFGSNLIRDVLVSALRARRASSVENLVIPANSDGKKKMVLQTAGILVALAPPDKHNRKEVLAWACLLASGWYSFKSACAYTKV